MKRIDIDPDELRRLHWDEKRHVKDIAKELGVSRDCIYKNMLRCGIPWRGLSDAALVHNASLSKEERSRRSSAAHDAVRGKKMTLAYLTARAISKELAAKMTGLELVFYEAFTAVGLCPIPQYAAGIYNIDFAFPDQLLAIEIDPGNWHMSSRKKLQDNNKEDYLVVHCGWTVHRFSGKAVSLKNPNIHRVAMEFALLAKAFVLKSKAPAAHLPTVSQDTQASEDPSSN